MALETSIYIVGKRERVFMSFYKQITARLFHNLCKKTAGACVLSFIVMRCVNSNCLPRNSNLEIINSKSGMSCFWVVDDGYASD